MEVTRQHARHATQRLQDTIMQTHKLLWICIPYQGSETGLPVQVRVEVTGQHARHAQGGFNASPSPMGHSFETSSRRLCF